MGKPEDEIERKLRELETTLKEDEQPTQLSVPPKSAEPKVTADDVKADLYLTMGSGCLLLGILLFFNHVRIGTPFLAGLFGFGHAGIGFTLVPLMIGIGIILYDYKLRVGWIITAASCALVFFAVLAQLIMTFPATSLLGLIIMLLPLAAGAALLAKGLLHRQSGATKDGD